MFNHDIHQKVIFIRIYTIVIVMLKVNNAIENFCFFTTFSLKIKTFCRHFIFCMRQSK